VLKHAIVEESSIKTLGVEASPPAPGIASQSGRTSLLGQLIMLGCRLKTSRGLAARTQGRTRKRGKIEGYSRVDLGEVHLFGPGGAVTRSP
jgi:hypothetical protein